ncbi:GMC oxidoreductase [Fictibacillus sp. NRS-1165]|uniref:GMC oxidoreductase n=1 Tax=Fictibacillus sp. NRS-1165 TaxID=3144463 RepID=UPI003D1A4F7B
MTNLNDQMIVKFDDEIRMYRGNPVQALTMDHYEQGRKDGYARGFILNSYGHRPVRLASLFFENDQESYGEKLRDRMLDYNHYGCFAMLGEVLPQENNRVILGKEMDDYGLPVPEVHFSFHTNDLKIREEAQKKLAEIGVAVSGQPLYHLHSNAHLMGGCRMGSDPETSVVNSFGQSHDIKNLFIAGSASFVTAPAANPTLTVYSLALRTAEYILEEMKTGNL